MKQLENLLTFLTQMVCQTVHIQFKGVQSVYFSSVQFGCSSCPILCSPMDCSNPGFPVHHQLPELVHVHQCHPTISSSVVPFSSCLQSFPVSGSFQMSQLFTSGGQNIGASASASFLPMICSTDFL